jgi:phosphoribosylglycinamide formyltransferase 1
MSKFRIAIFASGSGTNAEAIIQYFQNHSAIEVPLILSNNPAAMVLERAQKYSIPTKIFSRQQFIESEIVFHWLQEYQITHIVLAGFLWLIPDYLINAYPGKMINIHPALLPKYGGKGMYGLKVHQAVKSAGEHETGITIHLVNPQYDEGKILFQTSCKIEEQHTPEEIAQCVHQLEYEHYPKVIEKWILNG